MSILSPRLCVYLYCTHWLWLYSCLSSLTDWSIASIQGTPHGHRTPDTTQSQMLSSGSQTNNHNRRFKQGLTINNFTQKTSTTNNYCNLMMNKPSVLCCCIPRMKCSLDRCPLCRPCIQHQDTKHWVNSSVGTCTTQHTGLGGEHC